MDIYYFLNVQVMLDHHPSRSNMVFLRPDSLSLSWTTDIVACQ